MGAAGSRAAGMRTGILVQVRLVSARLPGKALLALAGDTVIGHVMRALSRVPADVRALATDARSAAELSEAARPHGFLVFQGETEDVLGRFCSAARALRLERLIRATGDNPLVCPRLAREILAVHEQRHAALSHFLGNPWGTGVEVVETPALLEAAREARAPGEREHLTTWLYRHRERFVIVEEEAPEDCRLPEARVTVDTKEDLERVRRIFEELYHGEPLEADAVVRWWRHAHDRAEARVNG